MYSQLLPGGEAPQRATRAHLLKVGAGLAGGSCLLLLATMFASAPAPELQGAAGSAATSLIGLPTASMRSPFAAQGPRAARPSLGMGQPPGGPASVSLPGPSPWKELALAAMDGASSCNRDISAKAQNKLQGVVASMDSRSRAVVNTVAATVADKAQQLAGINAPTGFFDPLGISTNLDYGRLLFYREVELKHGRICMLAALGILVSEKFHPLFGGDIDVPAYVAFQQTPLETFWYAVAAAISIPELLSIKDYQEPAPGWTYKDRLTFTMKEDRVPGDLGFDPLGLKPNDPKEFLELQNKELNNGRLAMISVAGMIAQELATGQKLFP